MSSIDNLPDEAKRLIQDYINRIEEHEVKKVDLIRELAEQIEQRGWVPPEYISSFLKKVLKDITSDKTIDKALGKKHKLKYERYQQLAIPTRRDSDDKKEIEESSTWVQKTEKYGEPVPSKEEVLKTAAEIAIAVSDHNEAQAKELDIRLNEALRLADDKDKRIEELLLQMGELELQVTDLKKQPQPKDVDKTEELLIENDNMKQTIQELQEALRAKVKTSGFTQASQLPKQVWLAAINAINFYRELNKASRFAIEHNDPWKKIVFDVAEDGQLKAAKLEGTT